MRHHAASAAIRSHGLSARAYAVSLAAIVVLFLAINLRWIWLYRHGLPLNIDEAGYLSYAVIDYLSLHYGGLSAWIAAIETTSIQAPLTMALSSLLFVATGPHPIVGFLVPVIAGAGCIAASAALGRALGFRSTGLIAGGLTASCPVIINYARDYDFALLAALAATLALLAILKSRGFRSRLWAAAFGLCLGLLPLTRTMTVAFAPGLVAAALAVAVAGGRNRTRRLLNLAGAVVIAIAIAATWFVPNGRLVADYLLDFGYGGRAIEYGPQTSKFGPDAWLAMAQSFNREIYAPHLAIIALGVLALLMITLRAAMRDGLGGAGRRILHSPRLPIVIFAAEALLALTSTMNKGSGFFAPVVPALLALSASSLQLVAQRRVFRLAYAAVIAAAIIPPVLAMTDLHSPAAPEWVADLPWLGPSTVSDGRGPIHRDEARAGYGASGSVEPIDSNTGQAWVALSIWTASELTQDAGHQAVVAFGFRNEMYNVNTVNLQQLLRHDSAFAMRQIAPTATGESVAGYLGWLRSEAADACALLTSDRVRGDFRPAVNRAFMEQAARQAGFAPVADWPAPDGQIITLWKHKVAPANCN